jgi:WD40 repeat protein
MTMNAQPRSTAGMKQSPPERPSTGRRGLLVAALLALLLLGGAAGGFLWWRGRGATPVDADKKDDGSRGNIDTTQRAKCSDDDDPKYLEPLEFGPPIETPFDRRRLDGLADRPIPEVEVYKWQPQGLVAVLGEHRMRGHVFAASPDGKYLAVGSSGDVYARIGTVDTLHAQTQIVSPGGVRALAWAANGEMLAASCGDNQVRLYDVRDLDKIPDPLLLDKATGAIMSLSFSGDGKYLLGGDNTPKRGVAWVWEVDTRNVVSQLKHIGPVMGVALSPIRGDYRALTSGGPEDGQLHLWDAISGKEKAVVDFRPPMKVDLTTYVGAVAFSADGKKALSCHPDATVRLWDLDRFEKDRELQILKGHASLPLAAFSPDGRSVTTGRFADAGVWLWDAQTGAKVRQVASGGGAVYGISFLDNARLVFANTVSNDHNVRVYDVETGKEHRPPIGHLMALTCVGFSPDGQRMATGGGDYALRLWDTETAAERRAIAASHMWGLGFHPDAKRVYWYGVHHAALPFADVESGQLRSPTYDKQHNGAVWSAAITRDGRYALTGGYQDGSVRMWRLQDGRQVRYFDVGPNEGSAVVTVSPDMRRAVRVGGTKTRLLQLRCQETTHEWNPAAWAPFLPDARVVLFGGPTAPVWQVTGDGPRENEPIKLNVSGMSGWQMSGDGKRIAGLLGGKVVVFDLDSAQLLWDWAPPPHFGGVSGVALSADGRHLLTANGDGTGYVIAISH